MNVHEHSGSDAAGKKHNMYILALNLLTSYSAFEGCTFIHIELWCFEGAFVHCNAIVVLL